MNPLRLVATHRPIRQRADDPTTVNPWDYVRIFGQSFVKHERQPLLTIGTRHWDRWMLGRLGCPHPVAAAHLNRLVQQLDIRTVAELAARAHEVSLYKGSGVTIYYTVLAICREAGFEPEQIHHADVTYAALKDRARKLQAKSSARRRRT